MKILQSFFYLLARAMAWVSGLVVTLFFLNRLFKTDFGLWTGPAGSRSFTYAPESWQDLLLWLFILGGTGLVSYLIEKALKNSAWFKAHPGKAPVVIGGTILVLILIGWKIISYGDSMAAENTGGKLLNAISASSTPAEIIGLIEQDNNRGSSMSYNVFEAAARNNNLAIIPILVEKGYNINAQTRELYKGSGSGETILMRAADSFLPEVVRVLLANGADVKLKDSQKETALFYALKGLEEGKMEKVKLLLDAGADADVKNYEKMSVRDLVARDYQYLPGLPESYKELNELFKK